MIPNIILRNPSGLSHAEFRFLCCIYTMTAGFQRHSTVLNNKQITEMTGLAVSKMKNYREKLISTGFIQCIKDRGSYKYEIMGQPSGVDTIPPRVIDNNPQGSVCRGAKETNKENINKDDLFNEFKKKYPANRFDNDKTVLNAWENLSDKDKQLAVASISYAKEYWQLTDNKYILNASNYILKGYFRKDEIIGPYKRELNAVKEAKRQKEYYREAEENAVSEEEKMNFISEIKLNIANRKKKKDAKRK